MDKIKSIELTLNALQVIIFGDDRLEDIKPISKSLGDTAKVVIMPAFFGSQIKDLDKAEEFFHVEIVSNSVLSWAEVWLSFEWKESNTRRTRIQATSAESRVTRDKQAARVKAIADSLPAGYHNHPGYAESLASDMLKAYKTGHISKVLSILNLAEMFQRFEEEDKQI